MTEGLNPHQQVLRMRGRPKILLARSYEEAETLYDTYKNNILGIISDVSFNRNNEKDMEAGIKLAEKVKEDNPYLPFLLQSAYQLHEISAKKLQVGFINKNSKTLLIDLKNYLVSNLAFGAFIFKNPETDAEVARAANLKELQEVILTVPNKSLYYHFLRDHISKWLNARALFSIASVVKSVKIENENDVDKIKHELYNVIELFRLQKGRGVIANFNKDHFDKYLTFSRIGDSSIGGKSRGLAFLNNLIDNHAVFKSFPEAVITIPKTVVLGVEIFEKFMENNNLYEIALSEKSDEEILDAIQEFEETPREMPVTPEERLAAIAEWELLQSLGEHEATAEERLAAIAEFELLQSMGEQPITPEERIAAALEFSNLLTMQEA
jgi:hypothetical protein